ncbi:MAG TPA: prenyltransferase/squalene oxidase repeat-containing protein, partial [Tepidisphaeraceae bacterium]|nr:prenyltransferase/squalene oxidase repeat-containing protein [Tepidisphaeraceae bacterium]
CLAAMSWPVGDAMAQSRAKDAPKMAERPNQVQGNEITEAQRVAVEKGLAFLVSKQAANGSLGAGYSGPSGHAGITSLAALAFMANGSLPGRGKYGENVQKCLDFILANTQESGLISSDNSHGVMYGHGFSTLFLGEVYGMTRDEEIKEKLQKAVRLIERTQNPEGGWRYTPAPVDADISVTITEIMGLRAARDAGLKVDKGVIERAVQYVRRCQNPDGGFSYQANEGGGSAFPRSAAGVASLYYAGIFEGNDLKRGLDYLKQVNVGRGFGDRWGGEASGFYFYGHYYACQAMFLAGGDYWATYFPAIRDSLIAQQHKTTGAWQGEGGTEYATAMALIVLQMPNRYLPVFHGKGPGN